MDFKRDQYPFFGASVVQMSGLVKVILAFANAWRRTDAYILIGVEEVKGGRSIVHGVASHLDESDLQQLVNGKTNRPVQFSYQAFPFEGKQVGVIHIPVQARPLYLRKPFGKLGENVVYVRRGTSTAEASPDEIARMGETNVAAVQIPLLELQFANTENGQPAGNSVKIESVVLHLSESSQVADARPTVRAVWLLSDPSSGTATVSTRRASSSTVGSSPWDSC